MITGVLLAAGSASRFGADKLMQPFGTAGDVVAEASARALLAGVDEALAVVRPGGGDLAARLRLVGLESIVCEDADQGMGRSLACGVGAAGQAEGWVILLADMPCVRVDTVHAVAAQLRRGRAIVAPTYRGRRGHPVGFGARFRDDLMQLSGDQGARAILASHPHLLETISVDDPGILQDIDTPADLSRLSRNQPA